MNILELIGIVVLLYYIINLMLWIVLDSDIELAVKEKFGQPLSSLRGKVVWITGASSGIGKYLALDLAKYGVRLVISARRENELIKVKEECLDNCHGLLARDDILILKMDMLDIDKHEDHFKNVIDHFGKLDILVNNAGRSQRAEWDKIDIQVDRDLFELDVFSVINLSRVVVRYFKQCAGGIGHIAITSSGAGLTALPFSASYCGAKHALHGYFASLKVEEQKIDVTVFCPGPIATDFLQESFTADPNKKYGERIASDDRRMTAERCGHLFAVALANKTYQSWVGLFPVSLLLYITQYFPNLRLMVMKILGTRGIKKIREGK
ncbi:dehydrogenase/reductase SDR family member 7 [Condylostylus longicornis]|uniref:dehydrogenase/reductase SDR family member 7 n=1 Tax=Condylostylus longicornis TaxID=2530218 RepID=UPI00244E3359|nr:dehydrogenase/reductase SDR family member 7 [Condylostylus longicornis]